MMVSGVSSASECNEVVTDLRVMMILYDFLRIYMILYGFCVILYDFVCCENGMREWNVGMVCVLFSYLGKVRANARSLP